MKKNIFIISLLVLVMFSYSYEMKYYMKSMTDIGLTDVEAEEIFNQMPVEEKVIVLAIVACRENGDLDSLPPLKTEYERLINENTESVNLIDMLFESGEDRASGTYYGAKWYYPGDRVNIRFDHGRRVEYVEVRWTDSHKNSRVKLIIDGATYGDEDVASTETERFYINNTPRDEMFFYVKNDPVYIYNVSVKYSYGYDNDYEYGYDFIETFNVYGSSEYVDINRSIESFKLKVKSGEVFVGKVFMNANGREYVLDVDRTYYTGDEYVHELHRPMYVNHLRVEWSTYSNARVSFFVKTGSGSYNPAPGYDVPSYVSVSHYQESGPYQASSKYSMYTKIENGTPVAQKVIETLIEKLRQGTISVSDREALRALTRGNYVVRRVSSTSYKVIWW
ncbi:MAG: hypothetical protein ACOCWO_04650 [Candidatus Muiribacteriaceae bacterium]